MRQKYSSQPSKASRKENKSRAKKNNSKETDKEKNKDLETSSSVSDPLLSEDDIKQNDEKSVSDKMIKIEIPSGQSPATLVALDAPITPRAPAVSHRTRLQRNAERYENYNLLRDLLTNASTRKDINHDQVILEKLLEEQRDITDIAGLRIGINAYLYLCAQMMERMSKMMGTGSQSHFFPEHRRIPKAFRRAIYNRPALINQLSTKPKEEWDQMIKQLLNYVKQVQSGKQAPKTKEDLYREINSDIFRAIVESGFTQGEDLTAKQTLHELEHSITNEFDSYQIYREEAIPLSTRYGRMYTEGREGKYLKNLRSRLNNELESVLPIEQQLSPVERLRAINQHLPKLTRGVRVRADRLRHGDKREQSRPSVSETLTHAIQHNTQHIEIKESDETIRMREQQRSATEPFVEDPEDNWGVADSSPLCSEASSDDDLETSHREMRTTHTLASSSSSSTSSSSSNSSTNPILFSNGVWMSSLSIDPSDFSNYLAAMRNDGPNAPHK